MQFIEKLKEAEKAGIEIGLEQGVKQGLEQGVDKKARDTAAIIPSEGEPLDKITRYTGLSLDVIEALAAESVENDIN